MSSQLHPCVSIAVHGHQTHHRTVGSEQATPKPQRNICNHAIHGSYDCLKEKKVPDEPEQPEYMKLDMCVLHTDLNDMEHREDNIVCAP